MKERFTIAEEFALKPIPKAQYAGNQRARVKTSNGTRVEKVASRSAKDSRGRDLHVARMKRLEQREKLAIELSKKREEVLLWTLRELREYLKEYAPNYGMRVDNIITYIITGKFEGKE